MNGAQMTNASAVATTTGHADTNGRSAWPTRNARVLAVFQSGRAGRAVLREASEQVAGGAQLSVVTLAPQARPYKCCGGGGAGPYNCGVREEAVEDLRRAKDMLGPVAAGATFTTLRGTPQPPLAAWAAEHNFDVIILPGQRLSRTGGRLARALRRATAAEIRLVSR